MRLRLRSACSLVMVLSGRRNRSGVDLAKKCEIKHRKGALLHLRSEKSKASGAGRGGEGGGLGHISRLFLLLKFQFIKRGNIFRLPGKWFYALPDGSFPFSSSGTASRNRKTVQAEMGVAKTPPAQEVEHLPLQWFTARPAANDF